MTDAELIKHYGGSTAVARRLSQSEPFTPQRVDNWKRRGIPKGVQLQYPWLRSRGKPLPEKGAV